MRTMVIFTLTKDGSLQKEEYFYAHIESKIMMRDNF